MGSFKAYNATNQSSVSMFLSENVEALSQDDGDIGTTTDKTHWVQTNQTKEAPNGSGKRIPMNICKASITNNDHCTIGKWQYDYSRYKG